MIPYIKDSFCQPSTMACELLGFFPFASRLICANCDYLADLQLSEVKASWCWDASLSRTH